MSAAAVQQARRASRSTRVPRAAASYRSSTKRARSGWSASGCVTAQAPEPAGACVNRPGAAEVGPGWTGGPAGAGASGGVGLAAVLEPGRGRPARLADGTEAAVFKDRAGRLYAVGNRDPFSGADVIADGIMGSRDGVPVVASPMHKQVFDLRTGICLDDPDVSLPLHPLPATDAH